MRNPANVTRRRTRVAQTLASGFGSGGVTHKAPGKYTGKHLQGAADGVVVAYRPESGNQEPVPVDANGKVVGDKLTPAQLAKLPTWAQYQKGKTVDEKPMHQRSSGDLLNAHYDLHRAANGVMVAKGKAKAEGSGPNQAQPKRTLERSRDSAGNDMARGGNDEIAYGKAKAAGK